MEEKTKIIFKSYIARRLLKSGCRIVDIKPDKNDPDKKRTIFVFEDNEKFQKDLTDILEDEKKERAKTDKQ